MADHETTKTPLTRAWTDLEPKFVAWLSAGGLLTVASIVYGYAFPSEPLPVWIAPVVTLVAGAIVAYFKKSKVPTTIQTETPDGQVTAVVATETDTSI